MASQGDLTLQRLWYEGRSRWLLIVLFPLSLLFRLVAAVRRIGYRSGILQVRHVSRPLIVVGNITVGGTGKTPFVMWLTQFLQAQGRRVGVVLRGYGGDSAHWPRDVHAETPTSEVGDEAVLHALRTGAIVVAGPDRVAAAARAIELGAEIVVCDDGLQHYRLGRDAEIAVADAQRGFGNQLLLPAGPLREPVSRLRSVDLLVKTLRSASPSQPLVVGLAEIVAQAHVGDAIGLATRRTRSLESFRGTRVHAIAGIGNPQAFFTSLRDAGLDIIEHPHPDHVALKREDIVFDDVAPVVMTEKDAVKCRTWADERHWAVRLETVVSPEDSARVSRLIETVMRSHAGTR
ncbi:tetraacyldisaccharide 4'-kinase [Povalibacter uvarum]|uniref:Tetraacyldisaccharide 4'-kinase n=1 Tax=Povalibacter uvarum TaxID=732238 RepID=A0A841HID7_9GAMM|nr:tetraacyldisaccharide 4'-kinase [Povalibacter uvarum]MBB6091825.1 tetraacyldisaccharide 4'-kinase [Povalibacter uvarum]